MVDFPKEGVQCSLNLIKCKWRYKFESERVVTEPAKETKGVKKLKLLQKLRLVEGKRQD